MSHVIKNVVVTCCNSSLCLQFEQLVFHLTLCDTMLRSHILEHSKEDNRRGPWTTAKTVMTSDIFLLKLKMNYKVDWFNLCV